MCKKLTILFFFFLFLFDCFPQKITPVLNSGGKVNTELLRRYLDFSGIAAITDSLLAARKDAIQAALSDLGYMNASVTFTTGKSPGDSLNTMLQVDVNEGEQVIIDSVFIDHQDTIISAVADELLTDLAGAGYNSELLKLAISSFIEEYENKGFPFCTVTIANIIPAYNDSVITGVNLRLVITAGRGARIDKIEISGNESTRENVILREATVKAGDYYTPALAEKIVTRLNRLRFFDPVSIPEFYFTKDYEGVLKISLKEVQTNNIDGVIGYIPAQGNEESGYVTGLINISMRNLFGTGRGVLLKWQQPDRNSQDLELRYYEPKPFGFPVDLRGELLQRKQDTTYVQRSTGAAVDFLISDNITFGLSLSSEVVIPSLRTVPVFTVYNSDNLSTGVNFRLDTRDNPVNTRGGIYFLNSFSLVRKKISGPQEYIIPGQATEYNLRKITFDLMLFYEVFNRSVLFFGGHGREIQGDLIESSDLYRLGGNSTLRGFRENQFLGERVIWGNTEYRYLLTTRSYAFLFYDIGYVSKTDRTPGGDTLTETLKSGYGIGMTFETGLGILAVSYAIGQGSGLNEGKIHFGIINEF